MSTLSHLTFRRETMIPCLQTQQLCATGPSPGKTNLQTDTVVEKEQFLQIPNGSAGSA
jgi:hypothetical protein